MPFRISAIALLSVAPLATAAQTYLSDPAYCAETLAAAYEAGVMALYPTGTETIEYGCHWEEAIRYDWSETSTQIRAGYCAEPGEYLYPQVFVIGMSPSEPDVILIWTSDHQTGEPVRYALCD